MQKIKQLRDNSNFFRQALIDRGFHVFGDRDSPVIPVMLYHPAKLPAVSRECLKRNVRKFKLRNIFHQITHIIDYIQIAVVVVGFPATNLLTTRIRFCISAAHTREDLEWAIKEFDEIGSRLMLKYGTPDANVDSKLE